MTRLLSITLSDRNIAPDILFRLLMSLDAFGHSQLIHLVNVALRSGRLCSFPLVFGCHFVCNKCASKMYVYV